MWMKKKGDYMPVIGVIRKDGTLQKTKDVFKEAKEYGEVDGYGLGFLSVALKDYAPVSPSASVIAGGAYRQNVLQRLVDYYINIEDSMAMIRGTLIHSGYENVKYPRGIKTLSEKSYKVTLPFGDNWELSGKVDKYVVDSRTLIDYKTCTKVPDIMKDYHLKQLAIYTFLSRENDVPVDWVQIEYQAWNDAKVVTDCELPDGSIAPAIEHPLFTDRDYFLDWIIEPYTLIKEGYDNFIVPPKVFNPFEKYSPVRWVSDRFPAAGGIIVPELWKQEDFM